MHSYIFISDLHIDAGQIQRLEAFSEFLQQQQKKVTTIFILGDLFNFWTAQSQATIPAYQSLLQIIKKGEQENKILFLPGNRDFLFVNYLNRKHHRSLPDLATLHISNTRILIAHGDCFMTQDIWYFIVKKILTSKIAYILSEIAPSWICIIVGKFLRNISFSNFKKNKNRKPVLKLDLEYATKCMQKKQCEILICGHAHLGKKYIHNNKSIYILPECKGKNFPHLFWNETTQEYRGL